MLYYRLGLNMGSLSGDLMMLMMVMVMLMVIMISPGLCSAWCTTGWA